MLSGISGRWSKKKHPSGRKASGQLLRIAAAACVVLAIAGVLRYTQNNRGVSMPGTESTQVKEQWEQAAASAADTQEVDDPLTQETAASVSAVSEAGTENEMPDVSAAPEQTEETMTDKVQPDTSAISTVMDDALTDAANAQPAETQEPDTEETATEGYRTYQVQTGDTISSISQKYYGNMQMVRQICELNRIEKQDLIYTGQILLLP